MEEYSELLGALETAVESMNSVDMSEDRGIYSGVLSRVEDIAEDGELVELCNREEYEELSVDEVEPRSVTNNRWPHRALSHEILSEEYTRELEEISRERQASYQRRFEETHQRITNRRLTMRLLPMVMRGIGILVGMLLDGSGVMAVESVIHGSESAVEGTVSSISEKLLEMLYDELGNG